MYGLEEIKTMNEEATDKAVASTFKLFEGPPEAAIEDKRFLKAGLSTCLEALNLILEGHPPTKVAIGAITAIQHAAGALTEDEATELCRQQDLIDAMGEASSGTSEQAAAA